jgi:hypothetical protein
MAAAALSKSKGFPWALRWHPAQVSAVTGWRPALRAPMGSRMTASGLYSLPAPWHDSQPTPSVGLKDWRAGTGWPAPVAWHFRQAGDVCGSSSTPTRFAVSRAAGVDSVAQARAWGLSRQRLYW